MILSKYSSYFRKFDWILFFAVLFLMMLGLSAIYGINLSLDNGSFLTFKKQILFIGIGIVLMFVTSLLDYRMLKNYSRFLYVFALVLLLAVLLFGKTIRGTTGWFVFGSFSFQPVEVVKLISILFIAKYFTEWARLISQFKHVFISGLGVFILFVLVMAQSDFGSAIVLFFVWFFMTMVAGIKRSHLLFILSTFVVMGSFLWMFVLQDYQKGRITAFLNPEDDPLGRGYNLTQSIIAVGGGGITGTGLGAGSQSQLKFLPESQTDFIFAALAEELGFMGVLFLLFLFGVVFFRMAKIAKETRDDFAVFLVLGVMISFFVQIVINIGMNIGVMPVTGISLPFVSYGGSYLVISLIMVGLVQAVIIHSRQGL